jgi:RimJ/RimL family protein N-acetyltransferase
VAEGVAFRLRPVEVQDAAFILQLRTLETLNRFLHPVSPDLANQEAYIRLYLERPEDYYFIIERRDDTSPQGAVGIYDIDLGARAAEWGRWVVLPGSMAAVESAWLLYSVAFDVLNLDRLYSRTVADNSRVVSFHESCGASLARRLPRHYQLRGVPYEAVEHEMTRDKWPRIDATLRDRVTRLAAMLRR